LLIDRGQDKILCNESFIDEGVLILKMDGTKNKYFMLANENLIPDLNVISYLRKLRYQHLNILTRELTDGRTLEIILVPNDVEVRIGNRVQIDAEDVDDGILNVEKSNQKILVKGGCIAAIIFEFTYQTKNGGEIIIEQSFYHDYFKGDRVWINERMAPDGPYKLKSFPNIVVKDGKIIKKSIF
jgi:hypothetical protein